MWTNNKIWIRQAFYCIILHVSLFQAGDVMLYHIRTLYAIEQYRQLTKYWMH